VLLKSESPALDVKTLPEPMDIELVQAAGYSLNISWISTLPESVASDLKISYGMEYAQLGGNLWQKIQETSKGLFVANHLSPKTTYQFRLKLSYIENGAIWTWPPDSRFTFETLGKQGPFIKLKKIIKHSTYFIRIAGDKPSAPGTPQIQHLHSNVYQVSWDHSKNNGAEIEFYLLEGREGTLSANMPVAQQQRSSREAPSELDDDSGWTLLYNGTGMIFLLL